ncbi:MAG: iron donor protein CyaY [Candidatus Kapaibacterium sp.]
MSNSDVIKAIDATLKDILTKLDALELDEFDLEFSDGKLVVEFTDGVKLIVNRQSAADQIWLAEPRGGWHYDYRDGQWIDDKRGVELKGTLAELIGEKIGRPIELA